MPKINVRKRRKQQLINACIKSINDRGLSATSITHICKEVNMSRGIINFYFVSKEAMLLQCLRSIVNDYRKSVMSEFDKILGKDPNNKFRDFTDDEISEDENSIKNTDNTNTDLQNDDQPSTIQSENRDDIENLLEIYIRSCFSAKIVSRKRLAAWAAFCAHACAYPEYQKIITKTDVEIVTRVKKFYSPEHVNIFNSTVFFIRGLWLSILCNNDAKRISAIKNEAKEFIALIHNSKLSTINAQNITPEFLASEDTRKPEDMRHGMHKDTHEGIAHKDMHKEGNILVDALTSDRNKELNKIPKLPETASDMALQNKENADSKNMDNKNMDHKIKRPRLLQKQSQQVANEEQMDFSDLFSSDQESW